MLLKLHAKLAPGWALIRIDFDRIQEIGQKVGGGRSFVSGPFFRETTVHSNRKALERQYSKQLKVGACVHGTVSSCSSGQG